MKNSFNLFIELPFYDKGLGQNTSVEQVIIVLTSLMIVFLMGVMLWQWYSLKQLNNQLKNEIITLQQDQKFLLEEKREELRTILEILPDLFFRMNSDSTILDYRGESKSELYVSPELFLGKPMIEILPEPVAQAWRDAIAQVLGSNTLVTLEYQLSTSNAEQYYEARLVPFAHQQIIAIVRNISQQKQTEINLKKSQDFLQTIINYLPVALFVKDGKPEKFGQLLLVNKACEEMMGLVSSQVVGKTGHDLFPADQANFYEQKDREAFANGVPEDIPEEPIDSYNAGKKILHTIKVPLYDQNNDPEYLVCISEDITRQKKAEIDLEKSHNILRTISLAQSQFIADTVPQILFNDLLENLLNLTDSEYGFIGEILYSAQGKPYIEEAHMKTRGQPYLKTHAITNIAWNEETRQFYAENSPHGMEFYNLKTLFGAVITTGQPVIANHPATDPRRGGLPEGHPSLDTFLGLPFYHDNQLVGMVGIANREQGYDIELVEYLQPFLTTCANLIKAYRNERSRQQAEKEREVSENKLKALLKYSSDIVSVFDEQGQLIYTSPAVEKIYGFSPEELQNKNTFELIHPDDRSEVRNAFCQLLEDPKNTIRVHYRYQTKNQRFIWIETVASNQLQNPNIQGIVVNSRDISHRKESEEALRVSEERFRQLAENIREVFWMIDVSTVNPTEQRTLYVSPAYQQVWGHKPEELYENPRQWIQAVHPDDFERISHEFFDKLLITGFDHEYRIIRPDGTIRWIRDRGFPIKNQVGEFCRVTGLAEDITKQKQTEEEIRGLNAALAEQNRQLEQRVAQRTAELEMLFNTLPDFVFVVERETMKLSFCNQMFAQGIGFTNRSEVEGKTIFECFPTEMANYFAQQNEQVFNSGEILHVEEKVCLPNGDRYFDTYKVPLRTPQGEIYALLGTGRDMTELVNTKKVLMQRTTQLELANQELDSFCYSVSHDLRAPLRHIHGFVNALKQQLMINNTLEDPKVLHYLEVIENSSQKMAHLIDGLLTLSRVGRRELVLHTVDLNAVVKTAINLLSPLENKTHTIKFEVGKLPTVQGDNALLQQVFTNLLDNALKFSRDRNPISIKINTLEDGTIFISDNGVGFDMEYADQLFGAFQRLHSQAIFEGTGIGLSIVQRIIHRHGGHIWAESQVDKGATFYFTLPLKSDKVGS
ncbi:PAS/PAC sensor signal transduction histidine kinase [Rippkaea orientalis PCC 8801]|uniref:histidine kinase n=1 Tax=Rippkaea orientalis (strain PCC 8801 / RF-1) TaxID=41431 RepID=B7JVE1_RIPO1|nr:PAS domain S-box protein [Rippkaea orientalis]ACK68274.1 PAS/PAC sensor signal transduction histidine kinase [Rippkaea orientalis PCC 8801]